MGKAWVTPSFKVILQDHCWEYLDSNDLGKTKDRTAVVEHIAEEIAQVAATTNKAVLEMLNKVFLLLHFAFSPESLQDT